MPKFRIKPQYRKSIFFVLAILLILIAGISFKNISPKKVAMQNSAARENIESQVKSCYLKADLFACYKKTAADLLVRFPLTIILSALVLGEKQPEFSDCHELTHLLGQMEYKRTGNIQEVFATEGWQVCLMGVYHGALEEYFTEKGITDADSILAKSEFAEVCGDQYNYTLKQFIECTHGLGHAGMLLAYNDLPKALNLCDVLSTQRKKESCYNGAMMENAKDFGNAEHPTKYVKADDPLYPCPILKEQYQHECYTNGVINRFQNDPAMSASICLSVPANFQEECFETMGRNRAAISLFTNPERLMADCSQIKSAKFKNYCISGSAYNLMLQFGFSSNVPLEYCGIADSLDKSHCYDNIIRAAKDLAGDVSALKTLCGRINEQPYKNQCLNSV